MKILKAFDPMNPSHVTWLKDLSKISEIVNMSPIEQEKYFRKNSIKTISENNPIGLPIDPTEFPMVHFGLAMKYANAVLNNEAWIPEKN